MKCTVKLTKSLANIMEVRRGLTVALVYVKQEDTFCTHQPNRLRYIASSSPLFSPHVSPILHCVFVLFYACRRALTWPVCAPTHQQQIELCCLLHTHTHTRAHLQQIGLRRLVLSVHGFLVVL